MQGTPLPSIGTPSAGQVPGSNDSARAAPDENETSDVSTGDDAPVSDGHETLTAAPRAAATKPSRAAAAAATAPSPGLRYACRHGSIGRRGCDAIVRLQPRRNLCGRTAPYCASDLQAAYGLTAAAKSAGRGLTVAVVDAYGYPGAAADLAVYRRSMGLPACQSGCLRVVNQSGRPSPLPRPGADASDDWRSQAALDLDMASAICPNCRLLLVQANSNKDGDLAAGVAAAVSLGAVAVANSYSGSETSAGDAAYAHPGRAIVASAGNDGTGPKQPCSFAGVVCVGGTTLLAAGRGWSERAWSSTGSGCSVLVAKPAWQHVRGCATRLEVDVAAVADPATGVAFYDGAGGGWQQAGGTGVSTPIVAALFALGPSAARANAPQWIWRHGGSAAYRDIVAGENGECSVSYVCRARPGYDGPTGWGAPARSAGF